MVDSLAGKRLLITGAAGYIGSGLALRLKEIPCRLVRLARRPENLPPLRGPATIQDIGGDVRRKETWSQVLPGVDVVFHLAAQTSSTAADNAPLEDLNSNVVSMLHLLESCRSLGSSPMVILAGTVTQAGIPERVPVDESHPDRPVTAYDLNKWAAEQYLMLYVRRRIVRGTCLRLPNIFGPGPRSSRADRGILNMMIRRALEGEPLTVYGAGDAIRDFLFVTDTVDAFVRAAAMPDLVNGRHFVLGSGIGTSIADSLRLVRERVALKTGTRVELRQVDPPAPLPPIEARNFIADTARFQSATGWRPTVSLADGIDRTIEAFL
ncbi:MAG: NAD-dependent epimerase/dehydratase family protein [Nitrospirae bacterium]|nr:NAD-dependent epimerase/dehydratase family protein [Nitrospirota bacterium]